jgi:archaellum component FlaC
MQEALTVLAGSALPTLMVLVGILLNRNDINRLDTQMNGLRGEMNGLRGEMNSLRGEFNNLRGEFNNLRGEFNALRSQMHSDMMMLMSTNGDFEMRISKLEERPSQQ